MNVMAGALGDRNIFLMILIFLCAGIFAGILGRSSASAAAYLLLDFIPAQFAVVVLFVVAAFVSTAMGTSVGTIAVVSPIAVEVAQMAGFGVPFCVATVIGGAMFGDNLSFISDTTIAATSTQGCKMKDKFRVNFLVAAPAALLAIIIITAISFVTKANTVAENSYNLVQLIPYVLVLALALTGINVFAVLLIGIVAASVIMVGSGTLDMIGLLQNIGNGISGMYETPQRSSGRRPLGKRTRHCNRKQHSRYCDGRSNRKADGRRIQNLAEKDGFAPGHFQLRGARHFALRCPDARSTRSHFNGNPERKHQRIRPHPLYVLSVPVTCQRTHIHCNFSAQKQALVQLQTKFSNN
jgi:hypothetical protein